MVFPKVTLPASSILGASRSVWYGFIEFCRPFLHLQSLPPVVKNWGFDQIAYLGLVFQDLEASSGPQDSLPRCQLFQACTEHPSTPGAIAGT